MENPMKYYKPGHGESIDDAVSFMTKWDDTGCGVGAAEDAAAHYHERGGDLATWPIRFTLVEDDGTPLGCFDIERGVIPEFTATKWG